MAAKIVRSLWIYITWSSYKLYVHKNLIMNLMNNNEFVPVRKKWLLFWQAMVDKLAEVCSLSGMKESFAIESLFEMMENAFFFTLKFLFVLEILKYFFWLFRHVGKCDALRDLVALVQLKKREKHPWRSLNFSKVAKLRNVPQMAW